MVNDFRYIVFTRKVLESGLKSEQIAVFLAFVYLNLEKERISLSKVASLSSVRQDRALRAICVLKSLNMIDAAYKPIPVGLWIAQGIPED